MDNFISDFDVFWKKYVHTIVHGHVFPFVLHLLMTSQSSILKK
jgi:hypothetical protein